MTGGLQLAAAATESRRRWAEAAAGLESSTGQDAQHHSGMSSGSVTVAVEQIASEQHSGTGTEASIESRTINAEPAQGELPVAIPGAPTAAEANAEDLPTGPPP